MNFPEIEHLAESIDKLAAALGDKSAAALMREQKWNAEAPAAPQQTVQPQHPDEAPAPVAQPGPVPVATTAAPTSQSQAIPTSTKTYSMEELARAAAPLMDAGKADDLASLLHNTFNVQALTQLDKSQYGAFAAGLRRLGAQI